MKKNNRSAQSIKTTLMLSCYFYTLIHVVVYASTHNVSAQSTLSPWIQSGTVVSQQKTNACFDSDKDRAPLPACLDSKDVLNPDAIHRYSYLLDHVEYVGELKKNIDKNPRGLAQDLFEQSFYIQNNRKGICSGNCWYCYSQRKLLHTRLQQSNPLSLSHTQSIIQQALNLGFTNIRVHGEDTLDDLDSFWAIVDTCRNTPITFTLYTNGFYLLMKQRDPRAFFKELKERLGSIKYLQFTFSWDSDKIERLMLLPHFHHDESALYAAMASIITAFRAIFPANSITTEGQQKYDLLIAAHDMLETSCDKTMMRYNEFRKNIDDAIRTQDNTALYARYYRFYTTPFLFFQTPETVVEAAKRGLISTEYSIEDLIIKMSRIGNGLCRYSPLLDLASSEMIPCVRRREYPRRLVTPDNFIEILLRPFQNPRSRHLYIMGNAQRRAALIKQLQFALALDSSLKNAKQSSFEEVESYIFCDEALMTKIELLFLLDDILFMAQSHHSHCFKVLSIPYELIPVLLNEELLTAFISTYAQYQTLCLPEISYPSILTTITNTTTTPAAAIRMLQKHIYDILVNYQLIKQTPSASPPAGFLKTLVRKNQDPLPSIKDYLPVCQPEESTNRSA